MDLANTGSSLPGFNGVKAEGSFEMPSMGTVFGGSVYASINTFPGEFEFYFDGEGNFKIIQLAGRLEIVTSKRLGIPMLNEFYGSIGGEKGIPLVPPVVVAELTGGSFGINGISDTIDIGLGNGWLPRWS